MSEIRDTLEAYIGRLASRCTKNDLIFRCRRQNTKVQSVLLIEAIIRDSGRSTQTQISTLEILELDDPLARADKDATALLKKLEIVEKKPARKRMKV